MSVTEGPRRSNGHASGATVLKLPAERDSGPPARLPMVIEWGEETRPAEGAWIVKGLIPAAGLMCIVGASRAAKTFLALDWCLKTAHGEDVLGLKTRQVGVAYIGAEAANGIRKRIRAWLIENGREDDFAPFAFIGRGVDFSSPETLDVEELVALLDEAQVEFRERGERLGIVVIDTLARATPGADENSSADMGSVLAALERIGEALGVLVCVIHHTGKDASKGARGHSSLFAALDTAIELQHDEETGLRSLKLAKQKDDEDGRCWGFKLRPVTIGTDSDGDPITSCVIEYADATLTKPKRRDKAQAASEAIVLDALKAVLSTDGRKPPIGVPAPSGTFVAPYETVRTRAYQIGLSKDGETPAAKRTRWNRAVEKLAAEKVVRVWTNESDGESWVWLA